MCIRIIFGREESYESILINNDVQYLSVRRENACLKFAKKFTQHEVFTDWFPCEPTKPYDLRAVPKHAIARYNNTDRYRNSPLNYMRRLLNEDYSRANDHSLTARYGR